MQRKKNVYKEWEFNVFGLLRQLFVHPAIQCPTWLKILLQYLKKKKMDL